MCLFPVEEFVDVRGNSVLMRLVSKKEWNVVLMELWLCNKECPLSVFWENVFLTIIHTQPCKKQESHVKEEISHKRNIVELEPLLEENK